MMQFWLATPIPSMALNITDHRFSRFAFPSAHRALIFSLYCSKFLSVPAGQNGCKALLPAGLERTSCIRSPAFPQSQEL